MTMSLLKKSTLWRSRLARTALTLAVPALLASGCFGSDGDDDDQKFFLNWDLRYVGEEQTIACEDAGTPTVELAMVNNATGAQYTDTFTCSQRQGFSRALPTGNYSWQVRLRTQDGTVVSQDQDTADIFRHDGTDLGGFLFNIQAFHLNWTLVRGGVGVSCAQAGAANVVLYAQLGGGMAQRYVFPCAESAGVTTAIPIGTYAVWLELQNAQGGVITAIQAMTFPVRGTELAILPPITWVIP